MKHLVAALLVIVMPLSPAFGWGQYGHRMIAEIADANMTPLTKQRARALFRARPLLGTPKCPLIDIGDASVWADCVRRDQLRWRYTNTWHYQNIDVCKPFDLQMPCADGNCVSAQIDRNFALLKDQGLPTHVRLEAFAFLVHFVGDLHQPLHAGDRSDRGGNDVDANYGIMPNWNLHSIWDGALAERSLSAAPPLVRRYSDKEQAGLSVGTAVDWSREAWEVSKDIAYPRAFDSDGCTPPPEAPVTIDEADVAASRAAVRLQVQRAGLRLARLLDDALR